MACIAVVGGLETEPGPRYGRISARFRFEDPGQGARYDSAPWSAFLWLRVGNVTQDGLFATGPRGETVLSRKTCLSTSESKVPLKTPL